MDKITTLNNHIEFKRISVKSGGKIKDIERYISKFINSNKKSLDKFNENDVSKFLNSLGYSIGTTNDIKTFLKVFIKWHYPDWSSRFRNLDKICKSRKRPRAYEPEQMLSLEEVEKIVRKEKDLMWKVYWLVMFYGGFRPSEACNLKWEENIFFEPKGLIIKIRTTKTGRDFYKTIPRNAEHLLKEWKKYNSSEWVFPSPFKKGSNPIGARAVCWRMKKVSMKALGKKVVPYQLRHSIATILYGDDKRKDDDTANQLGHSKSMKSVYMNLDEDKLKQKARALWIKTKPLTPEKRQELELEIEKLKKKMKDSVSKKDLKILIKQNMLNFLKQYSMKTSAQKPTIDILTH